MMGRTGSLSRGHAAGRWDSTAIRQVVIGCFTDSLHVTPVPDGATTGNLSNASAVRSCGLCLTAMGRSSIGVAGVGRVGQKRVGQHHRLLGEDTPIDGAQDLGLSE